jgi:hypothetical protein
LTSKIILAILRTNSGKGALLLPTLVFILIAYGLYALHIAWSRRQGDWLASRERDRKSRRLLMAGSGLCLVGLIFASLWLPFDSPEENQRLAELMVGQTDGWLMARADPHVEYLPIKTPATVEKPVYPFLHPEATYVQSAPGKKPLPARTLRKPHLKKAAVAKGKKSQLSSRTAQKDKSAGKGTLKKKKGEARPNQAAAPAREASLRFGIWPTWDLHHHSPQDDRGGAR